MKININRQHLLTGVIVLTASVLLYTGGYYLFVTPAKANVSELETQLGIQEELISGANSSSEETSLASSTQLQEKIPVVKATDQMLLKIKQIETESKAMISSLSLIPIEAQTTQSSDEGKTIPDGVEQIGYFIEASAENYGQMDAFLKKIAEMDRLIDIELVQFSNDTEEQLKFSVSFTTYYVPKLSTLSEEIPEETYQAPAGRTSPFES